MTGKEKHILWENRGKLEPTHIRYRLKWTGLQNNNPSQCINLIFPGFLLHSSRICESNHTCYIIHTGALFTLFIQLDRTDAINKITITPSYYITTVKPKPRTIHKRPSIKRVYKDTLKAWPKMVGRPHCIPGLLFIAFKWTYLTR